MNVRTTKAIPRKKRQAALVLSLLLLMGTLFTASTHATTHVNINLTNITTEYIETEEYYQISNRIQNLTLDSANALKVLEHYEWMLQFYEKLEQQYIIAYIYYCRNVNSEDHKNAYNYYINELAMANNELLRITTAILESPCGEAAAAVWPADRVYYANRETVKTAAQDELHRKEQALVQKYTEASMSSFSSITEQNQVLGNIYLELISARSEIARSQGKDSYSEVAFAYYGRDYSLTDALVFCENVKEYLVPAYRELSRHYALENFILLDSEVRSMTVDQQLKLLGDNLEKVSPDLLDAYSYLTENKLYDLEYSPDKISGGFTTLIPIYNAPFLYNQPQGSFFDLTTLVHEFGHYNSYFQHPEDAQGWESYFVLDLAEIHSQALELLFARNYREIFGGDPGSSAEDYVLENLFFILTSACVVYQFEKAVYDNPDLTLEEINALFYDLCNDYGITSGMSMEVLSSWWVSIPHIYEHPMYYISYATSITPSLEIWLSSLEDYEAGVETYLRLVSYGERTDYLEVLSQCELSNPFEAGSLQKLGDAIITHLKNRSAVPGEVNLRMRPEVFPRRLVITRLQPQLAA